MPCSDNGDAEGTKISRVKGRLFNPLGFPSMLITGRHMRTQALNARLISVAGDGDVGPVGTVKSNARLKPVTVCITLVCSAYLRLLFQAYPLS